MLAAAAYRAGATLHDYRQEQSYDYSDRDDVKYTKILAPAHAPSWVYDREQLWNQVELREKLPDSRLARSIIMALPRELTLEQNIALVHEHVNEVFVSKGMVADIAIHDKEASDGLSQPHCHVLLTLRPFTEQGEWARAKDRSWDGYETPAQLYARKKEGRPGLMDGWREAWENTQNAHLEAAGSDERISMLSYADQGINRTPELHRGFRIDQAVRDGHKSELVEYNRYLPQENMVRGMMDVMLPDPLETGFGMSADPALLSAHEISRLGDYELDNDVELGEELERD